MPGARRPWRPSTTPAGSCRTRLVLLGPTSPWRSSLRQRARAARCAPDGRCRGRRPSRRAPAARPLRGHRAAGARSRGPHPRRSPWPGGRPAARRPAARRAASRHAAARHPGSGHPASHRPRPRRRTNRPWTRRAGAWCRSGWWGIVSRTEGRFVLSRVVPLMSVDRTAELRVGGRFGPNVRAATTCGHTPGGAGRGDCWQRVNSGLRSIGRLARPDRVTGPSDRSRTTGRGLAWTPQRSPTDTW